MVSLDNNIRRRSDIEVTDLADALILAQREGQAMFGVNGVGRRIVQLLETPQTIASIVAALVLEFQIEAQDCEAEVREFLAELAERELIENP